jgi:hypothetical protein
VRAHKKKATLFSVAKQVSLCNHYNPAAATMIIFSKKSKGLAPPNVEWGQ